MVKFDINLLSYLESDDFRVLTAVETGMRNHEIVPCALVGTLSNIRSGTGKILRNLCFNRLLSYETGKKYDGYRLTNLGYDYLALRVLRNREVIDQVGNQIGVGKEASVYIARNSTKDEKYALKVHRLGRTSFKTVFNKRDYHKSKVSNWLYLSRLAALREFSFMKILYERGFNIPEPIDNNRHCIVMKWINGTLLNNISKEDELDFKSLLDQLLNMILELANKYGVVHGDFNEFNLLIDNETNQPLLIDFPQMISVDHQLAREYFERDVECIVSFFEKRFNCTADEVPTFEEIDTNDKTESIIKQVNNDSNEMLDRYLKDNLQLSENMKEKLNESINLNDQDLNDDQHDQHDLSEDNEISLIEQFKSKLNVIDEEHDVSFVNNLNNVENQEDDKEVDKFDLASTFSYSASRFGASSIASTFTTDEIRSKLKREKDRKARKESIKESFKKIKGDSSSVGRQRKTNKMNIKEDNSIYDWF